MTPIKAGEGTTAKSFFTKIGLGIGNGTGTGTVSGILPSYDGEDYEYHLNFERDDDNLTFKNSEHRNSF